jgi:two-component system chemotaxis sensor kinase CheA
MSDYFDSDELLKDFYLEAEQQIEILEHNILAIENDPADKDAIDEIFRAAHTLKGGAATVQMLELSEFTHVVEDLLDAVRSGKCTVTSEVIDCLLQSLDVIKAMLEARQNGSVYEEDVGALKSQLRAFTAGTAAPSPHPAAAAPTLPTAGENPAAGNDLSAANSGPSASLTTDDIEEMKALAQGNEKIYRVRVEFDENNPMNSVGGIQVFASLKTVSQVLRTFPDFDSLYEDNFYPFVDYYVLTGESAEILKTKSSISDATLGINVDDLNALHIAEQSKPAVAEAQPAAEQTAAPIVRPTAQSGDAAAPAVRKPAAPVKKEASASAQILNVDSRRIDMLMNLVSELVITKGAFNQVVGRLTSNVSSFQYVKGICNESLKRFAEELPHLIESANNNVNGMKELRKALNESFSPIFGALLNFESEMKNVESKIKSVVTDLGRTTTELHEGVLKIRMVPVDRTFRRFPKLVRDLSKSLGKEVHLEIIGGETEMDKTVAEKLTDPLMHCVRNSMDHGIETPDIRTKRGKDPQGTLILKASNQGNMVVIEITDDGNGIDVEAIKRKAIERGLIAANKAISDQEAFNLMMEPGFSTAKQITDISGRGVGLDVVKKSIETLNGEISIWSEYEHGTTFTIKLPLTLAIIQGLMVRVESNIYAIPITNVLESFRIRSDEIRYLDHYEVFNVREDVVSILRLSKIFNIPTTTNPDYHFIVIVGSEDKKIGLMVDALIGEEDVVIKPLKDQYSASAGIAGATILGDGTVSLIIDVAQLLNLGYKKEMEEREQRAQLTEKEVL